MLFFFHCFLSVMLSFTFLVIVWLCRWVPASGHPHYRVLPGMHLKHSLLSKTLGSEPGTCPWVLGFALQHTGSLSLLQTCPPLTELKVNLITWRGVQWIANTCRSLTSLILYISWIIVVIIHLLSLLQFSKWMVFSQSCQKCCGPWWCE